MITCLFVFLLFQVTALLAAETGHVGEVPWSGILFSTVNFLLFFYLAQRFLKEPIRRFLAERKEAIVKSLQDAENSLDRNESLLGEMGERLARVDQEIAEMKSLSDQEIDRERQRLLTNAEQVAIRIRQDAEMISRQEVSLAKQKLRVEFAEMAVERARELLPLRLTTEMRRRISGEFTSQLGIQT